MKMVKKILAVLLVAVMTLGIVSVCASAAPAAPKFSYAVKSQTNSTVTIEFKLASGAFNSFDIKFDVSGNIGACQSIKTTSEFNNTRFSYEDNGAVVTTASNPKTAMISIASTKAFDKAISICEAVFAKKSSATVKSSDCKIVFSSCVVSSGGKNVDVTAKTTAFRSDAGYITFDSTSIKANYKSTAKIGYKSSYTAKQIKWESSNTKVATVDNQGNVKMTGKGTATITARSTDGFASAKCTVEVGYSAVQWIIIIVLFGWIWYI